MWLPSGMNLPGLSMHSLPFSLIPSALNRHPSASNSTTMVPAPGGGGRRIPTFRHSVSRSQQTVTSRTTVARRTPGVLRFCQDSLKFIAGPEVYEFGEFRLEASERQFSKGTERIPLAPKDVLASLLRNTGWLVTKSELLEQVWPGSFLEEGILAVHIAHRTGTRSSLLTASMFDFPDCNLRSRNRGGPDLRARPCWPGSCSLRASRTTLGPAAQHTATRRRRLCAHFQWTLRTRTHMLCSPRFCSSARGIGSVQEEPGTGTRTEPLAHRSTPLVRQVL